MDINNLMSALDNEKNESIMNLTTAKIQEIIFKILKELHLDRETFINYFKKLKGYKYVDEINELKHGGFIRWIPITDPNNLPLNNCGIICDIAIKDKGVYIVCKNFMHRQYSFKMDECLIFQKLTSQELIILSALDHLDKTKNDEYESEEYESDESETESDEDDKKKYKKTSKKGTAKNHI
jgi:hypothetical protein